MNSNTNGMEKLLENNRSGLVKAKNDWPEKIRDMLKCIHNHRFEEQLSLQWLKERCRINGKDFSGKFKYYVGKTPQQYWMEHRIAAAKQLLREDSLADVGLLEIALELGFRKHSTFTSTFKNHVGCPPSDFRDGNNECE